MKKMLFIYNPKAGKAHIRNKLADILDVFTKGDYEITVYPTQKSEDAMEKTRDRSKDYDIVVCSGGDGTLDEVVTGMIRSGFRTPIGYIPAGSTNDFGGSLGLPKNMVQSSLTLLLCSQPQKNPERRYTAVIRTAKAALWSQTHS